MSIGHVILYLLLLALLCRAAVTDIRQRRIPNRLTLLVWVAGLLQSISPWALVSLRQSIYGCAVGFLLEFLLYLVGGRGGGDVKLLAGIGAWVGPKPVLWVFAAAAIVSLIVVLVQCAAQRKLGALLRNTGITLLVAANVRWLGAGHVIETGRSQQSIARPMPNALHKLIATAGVVAWQWMGGRWSGS
jgi:prepilin peptidase CpaA